MLLALLFSNSTALLTVSHCRPMQKCVTVLFEHSMIDNPCGAKRKRAALWTAVSGLLALISRAPISRHHELKLNSGAAIVVMK